VVLLGQVPVAREPIGPPRFLIWARIRIRPLWRRTMLRVEVGQGASLKLDQADTCQKQQNPSGCIADRPLVRVRCNLPGVITAMTEAKTSDVWQRPNDMSGKTGERLLGAANRDTHVEARLTSGWDGGAIPPGSTNLEWQSRASTSRHVGHPLRVRRAACGLMDRSVRIRPLPRFCRAARHHDFSGNCVGGRF